MAEAQCPFCGAGVDEDLLVFGGPCPTCFCDIPGEEAPTDPGEAVKAKQERSDRTRAWVRALIPLVFIVLPGLMLLAVVALYLIFRPEPEVAVMDFDDEYGIEIELVAATHPEPIAASEQGQVKRGKRKRRNPNALLGKGVGVAVGGGGFDALGGTTDGSADASDGGTRRSASGPMGADVKGPSNLGGSLGGGGGGLGINVDVSAQRRGGVLTDFEQIKKMLWRVMQSEIPKLRSCYENRLKINEDLRGRWQMNFVVTKDGTTKNAQAVGLNMQDAELERCLVNKIQRWKFQRIDRNQRAQRSVVFRPAY